MHDKRQVCFALGSQHTGGRKAGVIDEKRVGIPGPLDGVGRIGDDQLKGLVIPMLWIGQGILAGNAKLVKTDVVEKHIDAAQVVRGDIDFLSKKAVAYCIVAQHLHRFQQQGTRTTSGIVHLVDLRFSHRTQQGEQLGHIRRSEKLPAGFSGIAGVHGHQVLIGIAKGINVMVFHIAQIHGRHTL